jgi:hypothetical protein
MEPVGGGGMMAPKTPLWMQLEEDRIYEAALRDELDALRARLAAVEAERDVALALLMAWTAGESEMHDTPPTEWVKERLSAEARLLAECERLRVALEAIVLGTPEAVYPFGLTTTFALAVQQARAALDAPGEEMTE